MKALGIEGRGAQAELARRAEISEQTVGRVIWSEGYLPDRATLMGLASALHLDPAELVLFALDLSNDPPRQQLDPLIARADRLLRSLPDTDHRRLEIALESILPTYEALLAEAEERRTA